MTDRSKYWETDARLDAFIENQQARSKHVSENQPDELTALRKLASERLDRVKELERENAAVSSTEHLAAITVDLRAERDRFEQSTRVFLERSERALMRAEAAEAQLTTAREETRRAERDWTKALAERDEARAQRDAAQTELATVRAERDEARDLAASHLACYQELYTELSTTRAALSTLEQAAHALVAFYGLDHLESAELNKRIQALERALNEVSK